MGVCIMVVNRNPEYFLTIVRERNFSRAAEKLYISQSSLSQYIAKLEAALEVRLFDRSQNPLVLTTAGEIYKNYLESDTYLYQKFEAELSNLNRNKSQTVDLGLGTWRGSILFPEILPVFLKEHPQARINLHEYPVSELFALIQSGRIDFAVMNTTAAVIPEEIVSDTISHERILLVTNCRSAITKEFTGNSGLSKQELLSLLEEERFISLNRNLTVGRHVHNYLEKNLLVFPDQLNTTNNSTALKLAAAGLGFCFLVETGLQDAIRHPELTFFDLQTPDLEIPLSVIYRKNSYLSPLSHCLIDIISDYYHGILEKNRASEKIRTLQGD